MHFHKHDLPLLQVAIENMQLSAGECRFEIVVKPANKFASGDEAAIFVGELPEAAPDCKADVQFAVWCSGMDVARYIGMNVARQMSRGVVPL